jgi:uncharacterized protein (DUF1501 family)
MSRTRREFLKTSLGATALVSCGPLVPTLLSRSALAASAAGDAAGTVLVVVQLTGGNDGLNTVVPYGDDLYHRNRPTLRAVADGVHKIDSLLGFHPRMGAFMRLYQQGHLSVVQGVGYPNPDGDHAASMRNWQTGKPHQSHCQTGWLGRMADLLYDESDADVPAVFVGQIQQPFTLNAQSVVIPSIGSLGQWTLRTMPGAASGRGQPFAPIQKTAPLAPLAGRGVGGEGASDRLLADAARRGGGGDPNALLSFVRRRKVAARQSSRRIEAVAQGPTSGKTALYPRFELAQTLRTVAQLIRADLGTRVFYAAPGGGGFGGFDNHANQLGNHCSRLEELSESVGAFMDDLQRDHLLDRVLLMTFSEFGRTVAENGRRGTDHGSAAPMFLVGGKVKGGLVGPHPNLTDLEMSGQKHHTDFRRVYAAVLDRWLGCDSQAVLGERFEPLDVLDV